MYFYSILTFLTYLHLREKQVYVLHRVPLHVVLQISQVLVYRIQSVKHSTPLCVTTSSATQLLLQRQHRRV